jgi:hypothetical protein
MEQADLFGVLNYNKNIEFKGGIISPVDNFQVIKDWIETFTNVDGFIYPPYGSRWKLDLRTEEPIEEVPKTKRCAHLYTIPISHKIKLFDVSEEREKFRYGLGGFVVYLLTYLFGTRLQFFDWWNDSRIPINNRANDFYIDNSTISHFISHSFKIYNGWNVNDRNLFLNILYMHSKAPSYEWDWERFTVEYMIFDACFNLAKSLYRITANSHKQKFNVICNKFGIHYEENFINKIYRLRIDLFHKMLWDNKTPGHSVSDMSFMAPEYLRSFNQRIIPALLNYMTPYIKTNWWVRGYHSFDLP